MSEPKKAKKPGNEYRQGFMISLLIVEAGTLLEILNGGRGITLLSWPANIFAGLSFICLLVFLHLFLRRKKIIQTLSRVPSAISSIILFTLLVLLLGLTKQEKPDALLISRLIGLDHIRNSFTFLFSGMYLMTTLGLITLRRMTPFTSKNAGFTLNHAGLWIIVFAGSLGAGDIQRLQLQVNENQTVGFAYNYSNQPVMLPFTLKLIDFNIEEFPPKIALVDRKVMALSEDAGNSMPVIEEGLEMETSGWKFRVLRMLPEAKADGPGFSVSDDTITSPAALLQVTNPQNGTSSEDWLSCGNYMTSPKYIYLDDNSLLAMTLPEPEEYSSSVEIVTKKGNRTTGEIMVNKPLKIEGWNLYQLSYDKTLGKYSKLSVIEAIKDPWLPVIYTGILMVIAGAFYIFWIGRNPKSE